MARARTLLADVASVAAIAVVTTGIGLALGVWTGFPKGTDAYAHLTRLKFVADHFPHHEWLYAWSAGMPTFETYPELPYLLIAPITTAFGATTALHVLALVAMLLLGVGTYGTVRVATGSALGAVVAALGALGSMATWTWLVNGGVYARVLAAGLAVCACWAAARWLGSGGRVVFAATAVLLAAAVASHQFVGGVFAFGIGVAVLAHPGPARVRRAAALALATFLLASPAILPALIRYGGFTSAFLGLDRPQLTSAATVLVDPRHIGVAVLPALALGALASWPGHRAVYLLLVAFALVLGYLFAPSLGIPTRLYYVNGIEPFTMTFLVTVIGALGGGFALGLARSRTDLSRWRRHIPAAIAALLVAGNAVLGTDAFLAGRGYPKIEDSSATTAVEALARRTIGVNGDDVAHRFLPATASESVWFSYVYAKPQLRDYYLQGVVHPDWLAWANAAVYTPPFNADRFRAALDWFAIDGFTVFDDPNFTGNVASFERNDVVRRVAMSDPPTFRQYAVADAGAIWRPTDAPLLVVIGDRDEYDTVARMVLERVARPGTLIPIWWEGMADAVPAELLQRARSIVVQDGRFGDRAAAERALEAYASAGGRVVLDARSSSQLSELWPLEGATDEAIAEWRLRAFGTPLRVSEFGPARYDGGPWGAPVGTALRPGARAILQHDGRPLVATRPVGGGDTVWVGGNLFYHAKSYANAIELDFLIGLLGPWGSPAAATGSGKRLDPERVEVSASRASGVFVSESYHPKWTARWSDGSARSVYYAGPGLIYVPVPPGEGTLTMEFGRSWPDYAVWVLVLAGALFCVWRPASRS